MQYYNTSTSNANSITCCLAMVVSNLCNHHPKLNGLTKDLSSYGLNSTVATEVEQAVNQIAEGAMVIANVKGSSIFTGSEYVCILKAHNKRLVVLDPNLYSGKFNSCPNIKLAGCYAYIMQDDLAREAIEYIIYNKIAPHETVQSMDIPNNISTIEEWVHKKGLWELYKPTGLVTQSDMWKTLYTLFAENDA